MGWFYMDKLREEAVRRLQEVADEDLASARILLRAQPTPVRMAAFHAQQAAEKHIKAWLVALGDDEPPVIHDLARLGRRLAARGANACLASPCGFSPGLRWVRAMR
jgi:HEPN domain-containing protein